MGRPYYYFAASLPQLDFEAKPSHSVEEFLADCERLLSHEDYQAIHFLLNSESAEVDVQTNSNVTFNRCLQFDAQLRNEIAFFRAQGFGKDPEKYVRGEFFSDPSISSIIQDAARASNPLEGEKVLDRARWQMLDDFCIGHHFDFDFLVIYGLKLKILNRYKEINSPEGGKNFEELKVIDFTDKI